MAVTVISVGLGLLAGTLIGAAGIGGVILVPALVYFAEVPVHAAISAATMSFILTGLIGTLFYARANSIRWDMAGWLSAGAIPAALMGAFTANLVPAIQLETVIGLLSVLSGLYTLFVGREPQGSGDQPISNGNLGLVGAITGFTSALTGTGGPFLLVPILMWLDCPVLIAIGLSQVIQLPISLLATAGNFYNGNLNLGLGALLALGIPLGSWGGTKFAHLIPRPALRRLVSLLMISVGVLVFGKLAFQTHL